MLRCRSFACHIQSRLSLSPPLSTKLVIPTFIPALRTFMTPPASSEWRRVSSGTAPPFFLFTKPIHKSEQDDREYSIILLDNGLQATLVHDAQADKAAASLDVAVGHLSDPVSEWLLGIQFEVISIVKDDMPGLAHFCEHLLFMVRTWICASHLDCLQTIAS